MAAKRPQLAKLTRPRLHKAVARERLFASLDEAHAQKSAICVVGPPGAGKTTLVASWLDARRVPGIWYQVDVGDADLSTFFYYLCEAARPFGRRGQRALPLLTPEYMHDIKGFGRRFFRDLFARLPAGTALALDNYQETADSPAFHQIVSDAVDEIPPGATLIVVSRRDPPDCYARLIANERVAFLDWEDLKLTLDEARAIASLRAPVPEQALREMHVQNAGWAAGLTLMLESFRRNAEPEPLPLTGRDAIFEYFAAQIFSRIDAGTQRFLVATAILPHVPVTLARELTGHPDSEKILDDLYRRHLFTHRRSASEPHYWYHALFRTFLQSQAESILGAGEVLRLGRQAAALLEARGDFEHAITLYADAGEWESARRLIEKHAPSVLSLGRGQTLRDWIARLPAVLLESSPWLQFWLGASWIPIDQPEARRYLEQAHANFVSTAHVNGQGLTAAAIIESYFYEWSDFGEMGRWVEELDGLLDSVTFEDESGAETRVYTSMLLGILYVAPEHPRRAEVVRQVSKILDEERDANRCVATGMMLLSYSNLVCDMAMGARVLATIKPQLLRPEITPFNLVWWYLREGYYHMIKGDYDAAKEALDRAVSIGETHGLQGARRTSILIASYQISCHAMLGDVRGARTWYQRVVDMADQRRPMDELHLAQSRVHVECAAANYEYIAGAAEHLIDAAMRTGQRYIQMLSVEHAATAYAILGWRTEFDRTRRRLVEMVSGTCFGFLECQAKFLDAVIALREGAVERAPGLIRAALDFARDRQFEYPQMARYSITTGDVLAEAFRLGIETDYATQIVRRYQVAPPKRAPRSWPWPVRVYTLGRFAIELDGETLEFHGKAPRKPLSLLKALIALGAERVPSERLTDVLWPEEDADRAAKALDVNLVRLRRLLARPDAISVAEDQISLNRNLCWLDTWEFEKQLGSLDELLARTDGAAQLPAQLAGAFEIYCGEFLPGDIESAWTLKQRERLRALFCRLVERAGAQLEAAGDWAPAIECYQRGLEIDDLVESFYLGLMRSYRSMGRTADALAAYRRLRRLLSVVLGVSPSEESQRLACSLQADNPARFDLE